MVINIINFSPQHNMLRIEISGEITFEEICAFFRQLFNEKTLPSDCKKVLIIDNSTESPTLKFNHKLLADLYSDFPNEINNLRVAVCTDHVEFYGLITNIRSYFKNPINRPFSDEQAAIKWLNSTF